MPEDLNYRSAVEIMKYTLVCSPDTEEFPLPYCEDDKGNRFSWTPLTDMNQVMMVDDELLKQHWALTLKRVADGRCAAMYERFHGGWDITDWFHGTPNDAILTAALAAKATEVKP